MKVIVPKISGFCGGVERAIRLAYGAAERVRGEVFIDGELVHNKEVMQDIISKGIKLLEDFDENAKFNQEDCVLIRAHGIPADRRLKLQKLFKNFVDGTCPHVAKVTEAIKQAEADGFTVIIIGDRKHPEVIALADGAGEKSCFIVSSEGEVDVLPKDLGKVMVVAQSTISADFFNKLAEKIYQKFSTVVVKDTICQSSKNRQQSVFELKKAGAEAVVVVGGKNSNNTKTLVNIAVNAALPVFHIETVDDLKDLDLANFSVVGVVSGASTSPKTVQAVVSALEKL